MHRIILTAMAALPEAKRSKPDTSSASASLPSNKTLLAADSDDDLNDCIEVRQTPPTSDCRRSGRGKPRSLVIEPQPINKPSILASASRWLSRVPSFGGLFSPVRPPVEEDTTTTDQSDRSARKARRASLRAKAQGPVSETDPGSSSAGGRKRLIPIVDLTESHHLRKRRRTSEVEAVVSDVEEDEEDELLLCPESARRRRREEEGAIAEAAVLRGQ